MQNEHVKPKFWAKSADKSTGQIDLVLFLLFAVLILFGLVMLYSASYYNGITAHKDGLYFLMQQIRGVLLGSVLMFIMARLDYRRWREKKYLILIYIVTVVLLLICFLPGMGQHLNGASRWIYIFGFSFQPSEFAKFSLMIILAGVISYYKPGRILSFFRGIVPLLGIVLSICGIILVQPNFSIFTILSLASFALISIAGMSKKQIALLFVLGFMMGVVLMLSKGYRNARFAGFLNPFDSDSADTFQIQQSLFAIGSGGLFGKGLANSRQKFNYLPYRESDFIFSIFAEERGFIGCVILMIFFLLLIWRGYRVAWRCKDTFGKLTAAGIVTVMGLQVLINIAVATSSIPATGVPLPFISFGSSSLACFMAAAGLLLSISRSRTLPAGVKLTNKKTDQREKPYALIS